MARRSVLSIALVFYGWQLDQTTGDDPAGYGGLLRAQGF